ncbi:hypothetical protein CRE_02463 [Caenorhabditis remanei]|uniref:Serpentine Receptor, class BC (Class B-like) n=1 Tax=Caenorhabditis remanei TaxID=31234 RepID=E3MWN0_CAERE|nr:hypothetical protein CRE_02463 [Caenorhabditis remanei]
MIIMNISAVVISAIGVVSAVFTSVMNILLFRNYKKEKDDILIFYCRFVVDFLMCFLFTCYLLFVIFYSLFTENLFDYHNFIIYISLPASSLKATRSIVNLSIYMERVMAVYAPIFFHKHKQFFSPLPIIVIAASFGLTEPIVLFGFCRYDFDYQKTCAALGCAVNQCFHNYWSTHKLVRFLKPCAITASNLFSLLDHIRIYFLANRLAIIDAAIIFCSDFLPLLASRLVVFSFQNVGPHGAVLHSVGLAFESFIFYRTLSQKSSSHSSDSTIHKTKVKTCKF